GIRSILEKGGGEVVGGLRLVPIVTLDSGARYGVDGELRWILIPEASAPTVIGDETVHLLHEALEWKRDRFDEAIEQAARAIGLPESDLCFAFPAVALVRAVITKGSSYLTRLALLWIRPSERRELREEI